MCFIKIIIIIKKNIKKTNFKVKEDANLQIKKFKNKKRPKIQFKKIY